MQVMVFLYQVVPVVYQIFCRRSMLQSYHKKTVQKTGAPALMKKRISALKVPRKMPELAT